MQQYIKTAKDGRTRLVIKYDDGHMTTKSYPRVLMEEKLGRPLKQNEDVHHKDGNKLNNDINNLEVVMHGEHQRMHNPSRYKEETRICQVCGKEFIYSQIQQIRYNVDIRRNRKRYYTCSNSCRGKASMGIINYDSNGNKL